MQINTKIIMMFEGSPVRASNADEFESTLNIIYESMLLSERNGNYVQAEELQRRAIRYKRQWEEDTLTDMSNRFDEAMLALQKAYNDDLEECNKRWTATLEQYMQNCRDTTQASDKSNNEEVQQLRATLAQQLPSKVKESYQLLNLRQMEHHMAKQKDFVQAHLIQNKIRDLYAQELAAWNEDKGRKIDQAVANMRAKQNRERQLFNKRMQIQLQDYNNAWHQEKTLLHQRFNNNAKQLKAAHQRQVGSFKKQFTTKGGIFSTKYDDSAQ